jgi:hypothetical protein
MKPEGQNFLETLFVLAHMNNNQFLTGLSGMNRADLHYGHYV